MTVATYPQNPYPVQPPYPQKAYPMQQPMPVYPMQPYPPQYPQAPAVSPQRMQENAYRRKLRRTANSIGFLALIFLGLEFLIGVAIVFILEAGNLRSYLTEMSDLYMLENGMLSMLIFFAAGLVYCLIRRLPFRDIFPFQKIKPSFLVQLCVIGICFSLMSNYVIDLLDNTFFGLFGIQNEGGSFDAGSQPNILLYFLTIAILPALVEEFAFRGVIMGALKPYSQGLAILVSSALFALMHGNFVQLPFTFCCGLVFAYLDIKTNSLLPSIIVHFLNNGLAVLSDVLLSYNILDNTGVNLCYGVIFVVTGVLSLIFLKRIIGKNDAGFFRLEGGSDGIPFKRKVTTVASSPTIIIFSAFMIVNCLITLFPSLMDILTTVAGGIS